MNGCVTSMGNWQVVASGAVTDSFVFRGIFVLAEARQICQPLHGAIETLCQ